MGDDVLDELPMPNRNGSVITMHGGEISGHVASASAKLVCATTLNRTGSRISSGGGCINKTFISQEHASYDDDEEVQEGREQNPEGRRRSSHSLEHNPAPLEAF